MDRENRYLANIFQTGIENSGKLLKMFSDHRDRFLAAPGSKTKHQAWPGGYMDHVSETIELAWSFKRSMKRDFEGRSLPFFYSDVALVLAIHDLEKPFKYVEPVNSYALIQPDDFKLRMLAKYDIGLTPEQENALKYVHGEGDDHDPNERVMGPLAAFCHMCDIASARIWFDCPSGIIK